MSRPPNLYQDTKTMILSVPGTARLCCRDSKAVQYRVKFRSPQGRESLSTPGAGLFTRGLKAHRTSPAMTISSSHVFGLAPERGFEELLALPTDSVPEIAVIA